MNSANKTSSCFESNYEEQEESIQKFIKNDQKIPEFPDLIESQDVNYKDDIYENVEKENDLVVISDDIPYPEKVLQKAKAPETKRVEFGVFPIIKYYTCTIDKELYLWPIETQPMKQDQDNLVIISEKCELITCVACGKTEFRQGYEIDSPYVIVITTNREISLYPVIVKNGLIQIQEAIRIRHSLPLLTAISISPKGKIFIGDDNSNIYLLSYTEDYWNPNKFKLIYTNLTHYSVVSKTLKTLGFSFPIKQLSLCQLNDESMFLASLNSNSDGSKTQINFYYFNKDDQTLKYISTYTHQVPKELQKSDKGSKNTQQNGPNLEKIVKIVSIPISESRETHFIAFTEASERIFFKEYTEKAHQARLSHFLYNEQIENEHKDICKYKTRFLASQLDDEPLRDANYSLGVSIFVYLNKIVFTQTTQSIYFADLNPIEVILIKSLPPNVNNTVIYRDQHKFNDYNLQVFNNSMVWQHILENKPPTAYLMTSIGVRSINFITPADHFRSILEEQHWAYTQPVQKWLYENSTTGGYEASSTILLLSQLCPASDQPKLRGILNEFRKQRLESIKKQEKVDEVSVRNLESINAFLLRCARLLTPIWTAPVFQIGERKIQTSTQNDQKENVFYIPKIYDQINLPKYIESFSTLKTLVQDYANLHKSSEGIKSTKVEEDESNYLKTLSNYISTIISTLTFLKIIKDYSKEYSKEHSKEQSKEDSAEHSKETAFFVLAKNNMISKEAKDRLNEPFYYISKNDSNKLPSIYESLRELAAKLFTTDSSDPQLVRDDTLMKKIIRECPDFFNEADSQIQSYMDSLEKIEQQNPEAQRPLLEKACQTFCEHASRPLLLKKICESFNNLHFYEGTVRVIISRANALDRSLLALSWYKNGCLSTDEEGRKAFDKCYLCYEYAFQIANNPDAFIYLISATDELFHYCLYHYIIYILQDESIVKILLALKDASNRSCHQYLEWYLTQKAPHLLWLYEGLHQKYEKAAQSILQLVRTHTLHIPEKIKTDITYSLEERMRLILRGIGYARASGNLTLYDEMQQVYNIATIQKEYLDRIYEIPENKLYVESHRQFLMSSQDIHNGLIEYQYWDILLQLFAVVPLNTTKKEYAISQVWQNYLFLQNEVPLPKTQNDIVYLVNNINKNSNISGAGTGSRIECTNDILKVDSLIPILESYKYSRQGHTLWACNTLLKCGIRPELLYQEYLKIYQNPDITEALQMDYFYILLFLYTTKGTTFWDVSILKKKIDWFREKENELVQVNDENHYADDWYQALNLDTLF